MSALQVQYVAKSGRVRTVVIVADTVKQGLSDVTAHAEASGDPVAIFKNQTEVQRGVYEVAA